MLRGSQAVRLGFRAASRNPELSFAKALVDQGGNLLAILPLALGAVLLAAVARGELLRAAMAALRAILALRWPVLGGIATALVIAFAGSMLLLAGTAAFGKATSLLGARLGAAMLITVVFVGVELIVASAAAGVTGVLSGATFFNLPAELLALAPRAAIGLAAAAVFGWLEVARMG